MKRAVFIFCAIMMLVVNAATESALAQTGPSLEGCPVFPSDNVWNTPVDNLPIEPRSSAYVSAIGADKGVHPDFGSGLWEGAPIGIPYNVVPGTQPKVNITFDYADESDPGPYPIPPNPDIEGGDNSSGDRHVLVLDNDHCILYETWSTYPGQNGSWVAGSGAVFELRSNALRPDGWTSADAAGLPILPGLVRYDEVADGEILHAIRFTAPNTRRTYVWPARHYASSLTDLKYPPMGQRFRLKADFDVSGFSPEVQVILRALKKYGMILVDNGSAWFISGAPDPRWDNDHMVSELKEVKGSDFEAVDVSYLMIDPDSGQARQTLPDTQSPTVPTNLSATAVSSSQIDLSWDASTDNVGVAGYRIYRNGLEIGAATNPPYQSVGLRPSTTYSYRIAAYDEAGNASVKSVAVSKTTQPFPSTKFTLGDRVQTISKSTVRSTASTSGALLGAQSKGALGAVIGGPWRANGYWWWQVDFDNGVDGWVIQGNLRKTSP
jgi:chitodextrinase